MSTTYDFDPRLPTEARDLITFIESIPMPAGTDIRAYANYTRPLYVGGPPHVVITIGRNYEAGGRFTLSMLAATPDGITYLSKHAASVAVAMMLDQFDRRSAAHAGTPL